MSIRVHPSMNASDGGKIENAFGGSMKAKLGENVPTGAIIPVSLTVRRLASLYMIIL